MKVENITIQDIPQVQPQVQTPTREGPDSVRVEPAETERRNNLKSSRLTLAQAENSNADSNKKPISAEQLEQAVQEANKTLNQFKNKQLSFFVDKRSGKPGVRIIDAETKKVIKQIPPEEMLELAARIKEQIGAIIDEKI